MKPTEHFRYVLRDSTPVLQQWHVAEGNEKFYYDEYGGLWKNVQVIPETPEPPYSYSSPI